ncbi:MULTISPECIES: GNAT family N-acetyltransferase [Kordiimonas]|jgi:putative acetyltransferase|uniref:Putative acetyltransferase n=1 Tax=Kordiimonas lacus TaxID=637679 RepID=A0A1G7DPB4_9PROT|nr:MULTISPECIES: GNAT family N-acetyltransferase [Kordiimonas]SDE53269.1 putative acetyltransferase [Kordiimonas lacus]
MIKKFRTQDTDAVIDVWYKANKLAHPFLTEETLKTVRAMVRDVYLPNTETWVYEHEGALIGFISLISSDPADVEVGAIFLDPDHIGFGYGRALMDHAAGLYGSLKLDVFKENHIGRGFYRRYGFKEVSEYPFEMTGDMVLKLVYRPA